MKNIEINYMNESGYEVLYPKTNLEQIEGFQEFREGIYSKEEVDGIIESLRGQTGDLKFAMGQYTGSTVGTTWVTITLSFPPMFVLISCYNGSADSSIGPQWVSREYSAGEYPLGFGGRINAGNNTGMALETLENGFRVRNIEISGGSIELNYTGRLYNYLAFG